MAGDWRINADERVKYDSYFQQCSPTQGYLTGEQARNFFIKSGLNPEILRKIWDLSDITNDGRLDKREFTIACHLISSQVQKKCPLPATLPPILLSDAITMASNGLPQPMPTLASSITRPMNYWSAPSQPLLPSQPIRPAIIPPPSITPANRSKYLQQFHSLVDVSKTNGFMSGSQAKNILQQTGLSQTLLHQIWTLADNDKDGRLTSDEFIIAMHCCEIVRTGQTLPTRLPDEWTKGTQTLRDRTGSLSRTNITPAFASLNQDLKDIMKSSSTNENHSPETVENERKNNVITYEERRQKNYEDGLKELERRRQLLREQEEREQRERDERERKRELEIQKQKDEQERKKQLEFERQLERQRQVEQQREEERRKLFEQREAARKEMERKSRLEWERQRMQELSSQKSRLLEQINDLKSREKALGLELQSMDDTMQTCQSKINHTNQNIQQIDQTINEIQKRMSQEKNLSENVDQQKRDLTNQVHRLQMERDALEASFKQMNQSKEFGVVNRDSDQMRFVQLQYENVKQESARVDEQTTSINQQCKQYQNQMEQLCRQLAQLEQEAKNKKPTNTPVSPPPLPSVAAPPPPPPVYSNFDQSHAFNNLKASTFAPPSGLDVDPFQTVDPFASASDLGSPSSPSTNNDWFQSTNNRTSTTIDPFASKTESSPKTKATIPKKPTTIDPWGGSTAANNGNGWAQFNNNTSNGNSSAVQYRALYDYKPERSDEMAMTMGDIISIDPTQQQDDNWLFGKIGNDRQGYFPSAYAERVPSTPSSASANSIDTTSTLSSGSWVMALADYSGKTVDKHLSFQKGELILVREQKDTRWYSGQLRGKIGWFPRNYVRPATEVEIQNNKNSKRNSLANEKPLPSPTSPSASSLTNDNGVVRRQAPSIPTIPDIFEAIYPYEATDPADLSFTAGDRIIVLKREGDWWTGKIGDRTGTFPNNYVQKVDNPLQETAVAIAPFQSNDEGRLTFNEGQVIYIRKKGDKGWYQGEIRSPDQPIRVGWFPANCVQLQTVSTPTSTTASYLNTIALPRYIAIFPYEAQQDDELSFPADAIFEILEDAGNTGWLKARYNQQVGLIPSTYVKPVDQLTPSTQRSSQPVAIPTPINPPRTNFTDGDTSQNSPSNPSRISAIRELIETEQRYVEDLSIVSNEFIRPLNTARVLNDYEIEQLFINWYSLISLNSGLLQALHEQVDYTEQSNSSENGVTMRAPRSVSMSNIALAAQLPARSIIHDRHRSFTPETSHTPTFRHSKTRLGNHQRSPSSQNLSSKVNIRHGNDSLHPPTFQTPVISTGSMTITDSTRIGQILCSHLPTMVNDYFQYCNSRSQANKSLQLKMDSNESFRSYLKTFQDKTGGLSLNGFLTKPIQRVTRYPLLIEKILKHTSTNHSDYSSIKQAVDIARQLNERINQQISEQESSSRLDWLQQHLILGSDENGTDGYLFDELLKFNSVNRFNIQRLLILHGLITKVPSGKELLAFLFNDFLLFSTMKSSSSNWQMQLFEPKSNFQLKLYRMPIFLTDIIIASDSLQDQWTFTITTKAYDKPIVLKTQQTNVRTLWVRSINNAVEECQLAEKSIQTDKAMFTVTDNKRDSRTAIARLLLVVQEAQDLLPITSTLERHRSVDPYCEITIGPLTLKTPFVKRTINPKWNAPMQFLLYNLVEDVIHINIFDNEFFSPNENLGHTTIHLADLLPQPLETFLTQPSLPFVQKVFLNNGSSIVMKCVVQLLTT